jgi:adenine/guanine phosphoribosyltransferase-like PRPP-binding protein
MVFEGSSAAISHTGKVRTNNQDSGYAGSNLFVVADGMTVDTSARYVVIDDVLTTGATLHACALTLRKAGAELVDAAALAHG